MVFVICVNYLLLLCAENGETQLSTDVLLGRHAGLAGGPQSAMLPQSLLMAQHHAAAAQQLMLARHDPSSMHAGLVGHAGLTSASGLAMLPGLTAATQPSLQDYMHGMMSQQQQGMAARGELGQSELNQSDSNATAAGALTSGLHQQQGGGQLTGSWSADQYSQSQSVQQDPTDRLRRSVCIIYGCFAPSLDVLVPKAFHRWMFCALKIVIDGENRHNAKMTDRERWS